MGNGKAMFLNSFALSCMLPHNVAKQLTYFLSSQGEKLVPGEKDRCCYCKGKMKTYITHGILYHFYNDMHAIVLCYKNPVGENDTVLVTVKPVTSKPEEGTSTLVPSYPLPPRGKYCMIFICLLKILQFSKRSHRTCSLSFSI